MKRNKIDKYKKFFNIFIRLFCYYRLSVRKNLIYVESRDGLDVADNIMNIIKEIINNPEYPKYRIVIFLRRTSVESKIKLLKSNGIYNHVKIVTSKQLACAIMEVAQYILTDSSLDGGYIKRKGQIVVNTWHGTPFKTMGRSNINERHSLGGVQQAFLKSDYLIYPNRFMKEIMVRDYMLSNICNAKILNSGYPRNSVFFTGLNEKIKQRFSIEKKQVIAYLPTFRGTYFKRKNQEQVSILQQYLKRIDECLNDNQVFFVKLHNFNSNEIDFSCFTRVRKFPSEEVSTYDFLSAVDILVTDYSSVFFDFANTKRKIILFAYDKEEYFEDRGTYFSFDELPFKKVETVEHLIEEINDRSNNIDYDAFFERFGYYDTKNCVSDLCKHIFLGVPSVSEETVASNGKRNLILYAGSLRRNGITASLLNLLSLVKDNRNVNIILCFDRAVIGKELWRLNSIPDYIDYVSLNTPPMLSYLESKVLRKFERVDWNLHDLMVKNVELPSILDRFGKREWNRYFGHINADFTAEFDGYGTYWPLLFSSGEAKSSIWVHSDMIQEKKIRNFNNLKMLKCLYSRYDNVVVVNKNMIPSLKVLVEDKVKVINNVFDYKSFIEKSQERICLDDNTRVNNGITSEQGLVNFLSNKKIKFISIGRFSVEKGHLRLIEAFARFHQSYPNTQLIIIGSHGPLYQATLDKASEVGCSKDILIIQHLSNPAPILRIADCFVLSSLYESLGMVILEAASLGLPVVSTSIENINKFVESGGGLVVDNSVEGIFEGFKYFINNKLPKFSVDFESWNDAALRQFDVIVQ